MAALALARGPAPVPVLAGARDAVIHARVPARDAGGLALVHAKALARVNARDAGLVAQALVRAVASEAVQAAVLGALIVVAEVAILGAAAAALDVHTVAVAAGLDAVIVAQAVEALVRERVKQDVVIIVLGCAKPVVPKLVLL